jgi:hypothetical protein
MPPDLSLRGIGGERDDVLVPAFAALELETPGDVLERVLELALIDAFADPEVELDLRRPAPEPEPQLQNRPLTI